MFVPFSAKRTNGQAGSLRSRQNIKKLKRGYSIKRIISVFLKKVKIIVTNGK